MAEDELGAATRAAAARRLQADDLRDLAVVAVRGRQSRRSGGRIHVDLHRHESGDRVSQSPTSEPPVQPSATQHSNQLLIESKVCSTSMKI